MRIPAVPKRIHLDVEGTLIPRYDIINSSRGRIQPTRRGALAKILALRDQGIEVSLATSLAREKLSETQVKQLLFDIGLAEADVDRALTQETCGVVATTPRSANFRAYKNHLPASAEPDTDAPAIVTVEDYNYGLVFGSSFRKDPDSPYDFFYTSSSNRFGGLPFPSPRGNLPRATVVIPALHSNDHLTEATQAHALELAGRIAELVLDGSFPFPTESEQVTQIVFEGNRLLHLETGLHVELLVEAGLVSFLPDALKENIRQWQANGQPRQHFLVYVPEREEGAQSG